MYSYGHLHMDKQKQGDQLEPTYSSSVKIRGVALRTCRKGWTIGRGGEKGSGISVLMARQDDLMMIAITNNCSENDSLWNMSLWNLTHAQLCLSTGGPSRLGILNKPTASQQRAKTHPASVLLWNKLIWWLGSSNGGALGNAEHPFIPIAPKSTLVRIGSNW